MCPLVISGSRYALVGRGEENALMIEYDDMHFVLVLQIKKLEKNYIFPDKSLNSSFQTDDEIGISVNYSGK